MSPKKTLASVAEKAIPDVVPHDIPLTNGAAWLLSQLLRQTEWGKTTEHLYRAGKILDEHLDDIGDPPKDPTEGKAWTVAPHPIALTEKDRDACRACVRHFVEKGNIGGGSAAACLLVALGMVEP